LGALLDELRIVISPMLEEKEIALDWRIDSDLPLVRADRPSLMQVFLNLITNSMRALADREQGLISIATQTDGDQVRVEFADSGPGVSDPEALFQPFQHGSKTSGLGLYLSRAFLHSFGGEIRYQALASGACFVIILNVAAEQPA